MADNRNLLPVRSKFYHAKSPISSSTNSLANAPNLERDGTVETDASHLNTNGHGSGTVGEEIDGGRNDDEDILSSFAMTPKHLRKAVSTTFKAVSDSIKSRAQYFYVDGSNEEIVAGQDSRESHSADHQPRTLHRISDSLSRSGARFVTSIKNWHPRENNGNAWGVNVPGSTSGDFIVDPADSGSGEAYPLIDVKIPNPRISLNLDYPWLSITNPEPSPNGNAIRPCSSKRTSIDRFLGLKSNATQESNTHLPLQAMSMHTEPLMKSQPHKLRLDTNVASQANARSPARRRHGPNVRFAGVERASSPYDADVESGESDVSGALDSPIRKTLNEWTKRREDRKKRYEVISSMSPLRPSLDADSAVTTTFVDSDDSSFQPKGSLELMMEKARYLDDDYGPISSTESSYKGCPDGAKSASGCDTTDNTAYRTLRQRQHFPSYVNEAAERQIGFDLNKRAARSLFPRPKYTVVEEVPAIEIPSIDNTLKASISRVEEMECPSRASRPDLSRQVSILSNDSAESCALTSKSQLRVIDVKGSSEHHRRASISQDETAKERIRQTLNDIDDDERSFVVDIPSDHSFNLGPDEELSHLQSSESFSKTRGRGLGIQGRNQLRSNESETSDEEHSKGRKSAQSTPDSTTANSDSFSAPANRSRVLFVLPDDHSSSGKASKHYRRPSPCPYGKISPSRIPAPTYESPTASSRKSIPLASHRGGYSEARSASADNSFIEMSPKASFVAARLPTFHHHLHPDRRVIGSSETEFYTATEGGNHESEQTEDPFLPDDTLLSFIDSESSAARPFSPRGPWLKVNIDTTLPMSTVYRNAEAESAYVSPVDSVSRISFSTATSETTVTPIEPESRMWSRRNSKGEPDTRNMPGHLPSSSEETVDDSDGAPHELQEADAVLNQEEGKDSQSQPGDGLARKLAIRRRHSRVFYAPGPRTRWSPIKSKRSLGSLGSYS